MLILAHHFYMSSACLDGIDVLVTFVANRVESYVLEDDFSSLARLVTGVTNFHSFSFILDILIENGQLELLLEKYSAAAETATGSAAAVRGFRMTVLTSLKCYNPHDLDAFAMVRAHITFLFFSSLLELWFLQM
jgi:spatacsin